MNRFIMRIGLPLNALCFAFFAFISTGVHAQDFETPALFEAASLPAASGRAPGVPPKRSRVARARLAAVRLDAADRSDVRLNLFDDVQVIARRTRLERRGRNAYIWHGRLRDEPGAVTLVVRSGVLVGTVFMDGRTFEIGYTGNGIQQILELDPAAFPTDDPPLDSAPTVAASDNTASIAADAGTQMDVLVLWTPAARTAAGGTAAIQSLIDLAVANANTAYANSGINASLRVVHGAEVSYTETRSNIVVDLGNLSDPADGKIDQVHTWRTQYGADLVSMIGEGYGSCGVAYVMSGNSTLFASSGFSVVNRSCVAGNLSLAHELGHNQGLAHDPANASSRGAYSYAYGYQDPANAFRTVMSYGGAPRILGYSSPLISYNGRVTGTSTQDNARALNQTAPTVAAFRATAVGGCTYSVSPTNLSYTSGGGSQTLSVSTGAGCTWSVGENLGWITTSKTSGTGSGTVTMTAATNTGTSSRSGSVTFAGRTVSVSQAASSCSYSVSPTSLSFGSGGGSQVVNITTASGCAWSVSEGLGWITTSVTSGAGSGSVTVSAASNTATSSRSGSVTVAGKSVGVSQAAAATTCTYSVTPTSLSFGSGGGSLTVSVSTTAGCAWTVNEGLGWITPSISSGSGSGSVTVTAAANTTTSSRSGWVTVAGKSVGVSQAAVAKSCTYSASPLSLSFTKSGGLASITITTGSGCSWNASSGASWLRLSATSGTGTRKILVSASSTSGARSSTILAAGTQVAVSQGTANDQNDGTQTGASRPSKADVLARRP